jgi:hypothetical protein
LPARAARRSVRRSTSARPAVARGGEADHWQGTPVTVYVVAHPACAESRALADGLFCWLRLQGGEEAAQDAGLPVWFRSQIVDEGAGPAPLAAHRLE